MDLGLVGNLGAWAGNAWPIPLVLDRSEPFLQEEMQSLAADAVAGRGSVEDCPKVRRCSVS